MLVHLKGVLTAEQAAACRGELDRARWLDGRVSAGTAAAGVKHNAEADLTDPLALRWSETIRKALGANPAFMATALPARICPPSFNRYSGGQTYGEHYDTALLEFGGVWVRNDLAATLFLNPPEDYDGGELLIRDTFGPRAVKLPAGDMVLYPASSQHQVSPVTRGVRLASYFWIQSLVRDDTHRQMLHDLDTSIQQLRQAKSDPATAARLLGLYHNLLRLWSDT
jgi:PKHD-type hydroxylase